MPTSSKKVMESLGQVALGAGEKTNSRGVKPVRPSAALIDQHLPVGQVRLLHVVGHGNGANPAQWLSSLRKSRDSSTGS